MIELATFEEIIGDKLNNNKKIYKDLNEDNLIIFAGGIENYNILQEYNIFETENELKEFSIFLNESSINKRFAIEIAAGILSPIVQKLKVRGFGITKGSIFWYCLTYGIAECLYDMGIDFLDTKKKIQFCKSFTKGVSKSVEYWATDKVMLQLLGTFGISLSTSSGLTRLPFHYLQDVLIGQNWMFKILEPVFCGDDFFTLDGKNVSIWELFTSIAEAQYQRVMKWIN